MSSQFHNMKFVLGRMGLFHFFNFLRERIKNKNFKEKSFRPVLPRTNFTMRNTDIGFTLSFHQIYTLVLQMLKSISVYRWRTGLPHHRKEHTPYLGLSW